MPAVSKKQEKFMRAVAHSPSFAKKVGVPMSVGREFTKLGGGMPVKPTPESKKRSQESDEAKREAVGGMKKGGNVKKMAMGGMDQKRMLQPGRRGSGSMSNPRASMAQILNKPAGMMKKGGSVKKMAHGGLAAGHKSADGVAHKGKTKGKDIVMKGATKGMKKGGMCK